MTGEREGRLGKGSSWAIQVHVSPEANWPFQAGVTFCSASALFLQGMEEESPSSSRTVPPKPGH